MCITELRFVVFFELRILSVKKRNREMLARNGDEFV